MQHHLLLLAFGFSNVAMLGWLAAAAAPLLIHLWSRHRFRESPWAAMQFLLAAMRKNARRLQLQQWLLLAVRTLIIVLVVLAVAEPYGERLLSGGSTAPIHKILIIDASYSMAYRSGSGTIFARAKQLASRLVRESRTGDVFTVISMSRPAKIIVGPEVIDHAAVATQIETLTQSHTAADLVGALSLVHESLAENDSARKLPDHKEVYFFTDLQRSTWADLTTGSRAPRGNEGKRGNEGAIETLAKHATLSIIDLGQPRASNLAVSGLAASDAFVTPNRDITFDVGLHQHGEEPRPQCRVEFLVDDVPVGEQTVDVPAGGDATLHFRHRFRSAGSRAICMRAAGDQLEIDNSRWLVVPVRDEIRVLLVAGRDGAAKYLADALNPNPASDSAIRPSVVSEGDLADVELSRIDCVFLCNVAQLTSGEADRLTKYAAAGGGVVVFLGDRVIPDNYNALDPSHPLSLIPARLGELFSQPQFGLDPLEYRHPIVAPFRGRERSGLLTTPVARYYRLDVSQSRSGVEVAAAMPGGDPFIITAPLGRGRTVLVATDGSLSSVDSTSGEPWTTWPTWPSFLPIVRELLAYALGGQQSQWQQLVGTPLRSRDVVADNAGALQIDRPDGRTAQVSMHSTPDGREWSYADTNVNGIYLMRELPPSQRQQFAVNVDTAESNLEKVDAKQLPPGIVVRTTWQDAKNIQAAGVVSQAAWNRSLLWAVFALLFVESLLAWQFGRGAL